jgi:hypothetical protein
MEFNVNGKQKKRLKKRGVSGKNLIKIFFVIRKMALASGRWDFFTEKSFLLTVLSIFADISGFYGRYIK